jgi:hypothetical protein
LGARIEDSSNSRRLLVEQFIAEIRQHPLAIIREETDMKVLAEFMFEKHFHNFNEYIQFCSDEGKSLLTDPY